MAYPQNTQETDEPALVGEIEGLSPSSSRIEDGTTNNDSSAVDGSVSRPRSAQDVVTPLAHMPYSDQLEHKKNSIAQMLKKLVRNAGFCFIFLYHILQYNFLSNLNFDNVLDRLEMLVKHVQMVFHFQNGFSNPGR